MSLFLINISVGIKSIRCLGKKDIAQRVVANVSAKYQILDNLSVQSRASYDKSFFTYDNRMYAGTDLTLSPATGRYTLNKTENTQQYIDLIANYNTDITEDLTFTIGANNLLDVFPGRAIEANRSSGRFDWSRRSQQFGIGGRFLFARVSFNLK